MCVEPPPRVHYMVQICFGFMAWCGSVLCVWVVCVRFLICSSDSVSSVGRFNMIFLVE